MISDFEVEEVILDAYGNRLANRRMDIKTADGTLFEVKGWRNRERSLEYLLGKVEDEGGL